MAIGLVGAGGVVVGLIVGWLLWRWRRRPLAKREWINLHVELNRRANEAATLRVSMHDAEQRHAAHVEALTAEIDALHKARDYVADVPQDPDVPEVAPPVVPDEDEWDDLTRLSGIGPAREERLHAAGVYTYAQVAALTPTEIERLKVDLGDFVDPDDEVSWVQQAAQLMLDNRGRRC